jgi:aryl sulfotransferase
MDKGNIIWLASYPKSGNTWFRAFYTNLIENKDAPIGVNELKPRYMASSRTLFDDYVGLESADLTADEIECLRPRMYETISSVEGKAENPIFMKVHDAYTSTSNGRLLVSRQATRGAIYFVRNPLDIAVSFAHHSHCEINTIIERMADKSYCLCSKSDRIVDQLRQRLSSWSSHVTGWVDGLGDNLHLMRYEDMVFNPIETFTSAVRFAGLPDDPKRIQKALRFSDIRELQKQEQAYGFKEKSPKAESFFRKGGTGSWREVMTDRQSRQIIQDHRVVMKRFGYLNNNDEPVF